MSSESLVRALKKIQAQAHDMRKEKMTRRLSPSVKVEPEEAEIESVTPEPVGAGHVTITIGKPIENSRTPAEEAKEEEKPKAKLRNRYVGPSGIGIP